MSTKSLTLYQLEDDLAAFVDTEELVPADLQQQFAVELSAKNDAAVTKRDNVIRAIRLMEDQMDLAKAEEERIREHRKRVEAALDRFRAYVAGVVCAYGDQKPGGKTKTLAATIGILRAQQSPGKIVVEDEAKVPLRFKSVTVTIDNAEHWIDVIESLSHNGYDGPAPPGTWRAQFSLSKERIGEAIDAGEEVPGADRQFGEWGLRLK